MIPLNSVALLIPIICSIIYSPHLPRLFKVEYTSSPHCQAWLCNLLWNVSDICQILTGTLNVFAGSVQLSLSSYTSVLCHKISMSQMQFTLLPSRSLPWMRTHIENSQSEQSWPGQSRWKPQFFQVHILPSQLSEMMVLPNVKILHNTSCQFSSLQIVFIQNYFLPTFSLLSPRWNIVPCSNDYSMACN